MKSFFKTLRLYLFVQSLYTLIYLSNVYRRYTPVRSDSIVGELRLSEPTDIVLPGNLLTLTAPF